MGVDRCGAAFPKSENLKIGIFLILDGFLIVPIYNEVMSQILIVDDSELDRLFLAALAKKYTGKPCIYAANGLEAITYIQNDKDQEIAAVLLDFSMPELDGRATLPRLLALRQNLQIIAVTGMADPQAIVEIIKLGAVDYLVKPVDPDLFGNALVKAIHVHELRKEVERLNHKSEQLIRFVDLIGQSAPMQTCVKLGQRAAASDISVLITGESGTGKEMLARAIHGQSARAEKPFVAVNCGALPKDLVESILFGHKRGSFTGAFADAKGKFLEANGGTLFLDEVGELQLETQVKLLRALQQNEIEPVGAAKTVPVNIRIIAATNRNPRQAVAQGHFREDLFYRLNVFPIVMPPLRTRAGDVIPLADFFLRRYAAIENKIIRGFEKDASDWLVSHNWPGNVRELENAIFRAVLLCDHDKIRLEHLLYDQSPSDKAEGSSGVHLKLIPGIPQVDLVDEQGAFKNMDQIIGEVEQSALQFYKNDIALAARKLGIGKSTLYRHRQGEK